MKIVIHGTKGGYHIFTDERVPGLLDARPDSHKVAAIGQQAYSINLNSDKVIFSKYKIIRDVIGGKRIGNIAFSIVISNAFKLAGADVKALLDSLAAEYCSKYIEDDSDNLDNVREDWSFVHSLQSEYKERLTPVSPDDIESIPPGNGDAAFVYYSTREDLEKYLDKPYQDEYAPYKQVFFVQDDLKGLAENPLYALRHNASGDLTGHVDLENPKYKLLFNETAKGGVRIEVKVNGNKRSNKNKIRRKNELEIIYSKPYRQPVTVSGRWYQISPKYVIVDDNAQTVTVVDTELELETKTITFEIRNGKTEPIEDAELTLKSNSNGTSRFIINNQVSFLGEELKDKWIISGRKGILSGKKEFTPEKQEANVVLTLERQETISFEAEDGDGKKLVNYTVHVKNKYAGPDTEVIFTGDEIDKDWEITILHDGYDKKEFTYCPAAGDNPKRVKLRKKEGGGGTAGKRYKVSAGKHGTLKNGPCWSSSIEGSDVRGQIQPNGGYELAGFDVDEVNETLTAKYWKTDPFYKRSGFIAGIMVIGIIGFILLLYMIFSPNTKPGVEDEIKAYCEGVELKEPQLRNYKNQHCIKDGANYCTKIDSAIAIRLAINQGKIDVLKRAGYSNDQDMFKAAIRSIDDGLKQQMGEAMSLSELSNKDLTQVADLINNMVRLLKINIDSLATDLEADKIQHEIDGWTLPDIAMVRKIKDDIVNKRTELQKKEAREAEVVTTPVKHDPVPPVKQNATPPVNQGNTNSGAARQAEPNVPADNKSTLEKEFWQLVKSGSLTKGEYDALLKKYKANAGSDFVKFLKKICNNTKSFAKFAGIPEIKRKKATSLTEIDIE